MRLLCFGLNEEWLLSWAERAEIDQIGIVNVFGEPFPSIDVIEFSNLSEALIAFEPDIVTIVTPPSCKTPVDVIERVLLTGRDIFLDKLRPTSAEDVEKMIDISRTTGCQIVVGEFYRFSPIVNISKDMISKGRLGVVEQILWQCFCKDPFEELDWMRSYQHVTLEDLSYHHLGVVHYLTGLMFDKVFAFSSRPSWAVVRAPSVVSLLAEDAEGRCLNYHCSWATRGRVTSWLGEFRIEGSQGVLECRDDSLIFIGADGYKEVLLKNESYADHRNLLVQDFIRMASSELRSNLSIDNFIPVMRLIYSAVKSAEKGETVRVFNSHTS